MTELLGTSAEVNAGEKYIVRGRYKLSGDQPISVGVIVSGRSMGHYVDLSPGSGEFTVWIEVLEVRQDGSRNIGLMVGTPDDRERGGVYISIRITE